MASSFIPQRIKRAKQQITVKLYQDQLAMLDKYGRFIDDSRDYVISQALELVFKRDKEFAAGSSRTEMLEAVRNAPSPALNLLVQHHSLDHSGMREESALAQKPWARCKQNQRRPVEDRVVRRAVESRNLVSFVVSTALGLYLFRSWPFPVENDLLQMVLLQKPYLFYGIKYGFVAMLFSTPYIAFSILFSFTYVFVIRREEQIGPSGSHHTFRQKVVTNFTY
jgi:hypothetical protein